MQKKLFAIVALMRPSHWIKNLFVFLPVFFNGSFGNLDGGGLRDVCLLFLSFCFAASSIYCLNDIRDVEADRIHSEKKKRPVASGAVSVRAAFFAMLLLAALCAIPVAFILHERLKVLIVVLCYYAVNVVYCLWAKNIAILDVLLLSFGYVLRLIGGGVAGNVPLTHWIVLMTYLLSLFLALAKRRDDVLVMEKTGIAPRKNTPRYSLDFINQLLTIAAAVTLFCYIMYTVQEDVMERFGMRHLYATSVLVLAGFMRYLQISFVDKKSGDPVKIAARDRVMGLILAAWLVSFALMIYAPRLAG